MSKTRGGACAGTARPICVGAPGPRAVPGGARRGTGLAPPGIEAYTGSAARFPAPPSHAQIVGPAYAALPVPSDRRTPAKDSFAVETGWPATSADASCAATPSRRTRTRRRFYSSAGSWRSSTTWRVELASPPGGRRLRAEECGRNHDETGTSAARGYRPRNTGECPGVAHREIVNTCTRQGALWRKHPTLPPLHQRRPISPSR